MILTELLVSLQTKQRGVELRLRRETRVVGSLSSYGPFLITRVRRNGGGGKDGRITQNVFTSSCSDSLRSPMFSEHHTLASGVKN